MPLIITWDDMKEKDIKILIRYKDKPDSGLCNSVLILDVDSMNGKGMQELADNIAMTTLRQVKKVE